VEQHLCPVWVGYFLASPVRRLFCNPQDVVGPYVGPGMTVLDIGCAMGFFSLPMAQMVGPSGRVLCVDCQDKMLASLERRARRAGLLERLALRPCKGDSLCLDDLGAEVDFALAFGVVHEAYDTARFFADVFKALKPGARVLVAEPRMPVNGAAFATTVSLAAQAGFEVLARPKVHNCRAVLLARTVQPRSGTGQATREEDAGGHN